MLLAVAATPAPAPVALQYDEIARVIVAPATPPAPDAFSDDYKVAMSARPSQAAASSFIQTPAMQQHTIVGPEAVPGEPGGSNTADTIGDAVSRGGGQNATASRPNAAERAMHAGYLIRYTFYLTKGWMRQDDPVMQTATITKCDENATLVLNLAKKTYTQTRTDCPQPDASQSSKATMQDLGSQTIDGIPTTGSRNAACLVYVSKIPKPQTMPPSEQGDCESGNSTLEMYVLTNSTVQGRVISKLTERGHITALDASTADPLFEIPAGFTPAR
jgi:hypothetical protein